MPEIGFNYLAAQHIFYKTSGVNLNGFSTNFGHSVAVGDTTVTVEGEEITIENTFLDNRGNLVVK
ncbi:hypothetical protein ACFLUH_02705, partial [Chloroflexota bacterium]